MENKREDFLDLSPLHITWVVCVKNEFITLKSGGGAESSPELEVLGLHPSLL